MESHDNPRQLWQRFFKNNKTLIFFQFRKSPALGQVYDRELDKMGAKAYGVQNGTVFSFAASYSYAPLLWTLGQVEQEIAFEGLA
jgi:hypothetical protein